MTKSRGIRVRPWWTDEIWKLELKFERFCDVTMQAKTSRSYSYVCYDFLKAFPKCRRPEDFYVTHVEDWALSRARTRAESTVAAEVNVLRYFFNWMARETGRDIPNPATRRKRIRSRPEPSYISLDQLQSLFAQAGPADTVVLRRLCQGVRPTVIAQEMNVSASTVRYKFGQLRKAAAFPLHLKELHPAYQRMCLRLGELELSRALPSSPPPSAHKLGQSSLLSEGI